ncbi:N-acetyl sugar amidotransferase [Oligoflexia bacterium]|nr:N-acetyl sugar amidotransferase [Oligoflexia bacterium]
MSQMILDKQFDELPKEVVFCKNCVVSNQRPRTIFNAEGICSACQWAYEKDHAVDWNQREKELEALLDQHRSSDGSFDVVVPGSGGKDSAFVAHQLKTRYGMHPLCCTWAPFEYTDIGWRNMQSFVKAGFDNIMGQPNGSIHRKLTRLAFDLKGDAWEPFTFGQKAWAFHIAQRFGIKLIFYGENGEVEYGGATKYKNLPKEPPEDWERHYFKGSGVDKLVEVGLETGLFKKGEVTEQSLQWYKAPHPDLIIKQGMEMHWYSYYHKWVPEENFYYGVTHVGFETNDFGHSEGTYTKYASLDDKLDGFHWYLSYIKFGMGRASRDAQQDIRRHHITREEGVRLVRRYDGEFPKRYYQWFLDYLDITDQYFWKVMDMYREKSNVWKKDKKGNWTMPYVVDHPPKEKL